MEYFIKNKTFDELEIGDSASIQHTFTFADIQAFAAISGDVNPAHVDIEYAKGDMFHKIIAHGMWMGSLISAILGTKLPGPGTIYLSQSLKFTKPVAIGDTITARVVITAMDPEKKRLTLECDCINQTGKVVMAGVAEVIAPTEKISRPRVDLPQVQLKRSEGQGVHRIVSMAKNLSSIITAVVHPVDSYSLRGAISAQNEGFIKAMLVGPEDKIKAVAEQEQLDLSNFEIISTPHSHAAADMAVRLVHEGKVQAIMKGKIRDSELMRPIVEKESGLRTGRRMSHVFMADVPAYPRSLFVTDSVLNIMPTLTDKKDIIQNAIDLFHAIGLGVPRVAILAAEEIVNEKIPSTLDAAILCKMADRGQISGGIIDGPLGFDNAVSEQAAQMKGINSQVAGYADILMVPELESGNMLFKQLTLFSGAKMAGIVVGAKVPIILTSQSDADEVRVASSALAVLAYHGLFV